MNIEALWSASTFESQQGTYERALELHSWMSQQAISPAAQFLIGRDSQPISQKDITALRDEIVVQFAPLKDSVHYVALLSLLIDLGNQWRLWQLTPPGVPFYIKREPSPFTPSSISSLALVRRWREALNNHIRARRDMALSEKRACIFASAVLNGGLLYRNGLTALYARLAEPLDIIGGCASIGLSMRWRGQDDAELRRWFPDALTELLLLNLSAEELLEHQADVEREKISMKRVWDTLKLFFKVAVPREWHPKTLQKCLLPVSCDYTAHRSPSYLVNYATGSLRSHSIKPHGWHRIFGIEPTQPPRSAGQPVVTVEPDTPTNPVNTAQPEFQFSWMASVRKALKVKVSERAKALTILDHCIEAARAQNDSVAQLFIEWVSFLIQKGSASGNPLALSTIRTYFDTAGKRLVGLSASEDISTFARDDLEDLYLQVREDAQSPSHRDKLARGLREFHHFLERMKGAERIDIHAVLGLGATLSPVDANLISFDEYEAILAGIDQSDLELSHPDLPVVAKLLVIFGFRCGLRRLEVLQLLLDDVHELAPMEILVRPHDGRRLKTKSSTRKSPVQALLSDEERQLLLGWKEKRHRQEADNPRSHYLFSIPAKGREFVSEDTIFSALHTIMREVTGDETLRFHHLRHSFASWTLLRLMLADSEQEADVFSHLPVTARELKESRSFRERLYGHSNITRKHPMLVAELLGHSGPEISTEHYIHVCDILLYQALKKSLRTPNPVLVAASGLSKSAVYRHLKGEDHTNLLIAVRASTPHRIQSMNDVPSPASRIRDTPIKTAIDKPLIDIIDRVWRMLYGLGTKQLEMEFLAEQFEFSITQCEAMIDEARFLMDLTPANQKRSHRHRRIVKSLESLEGTSSQHLLCPPRPRKDREKAVFERLAGPLWTLLQKEPTRVGWVLDFYIHRAWKTRSKFVLHNFGEADIGMAFLKMLKDLGIPRNKIRFVAYGKKGKSPATAQWKEALHLTRRDKIHWDASTNEESEATAKWFGIRPVFGEWGEKNDDGIYGFRYLLVMTWIYRQSRFG